MNAKTPEQIIRDIRNSSWIAPKPAVVIVSTEDYYDRDGPLTAIVAEQERRELAGGAVGVPIRPNLAVLQGQAFVLDNPRDLLWDRLFAPIRFDYSEKAQGSGGD